MSAPKVAAPCPPRGRQRVRSPPTAPFAGWSPRICQSADRLRGRRRGLGPSPGSSGPPIPRLMCTKMSAPPSLRWMKPNPSAGLKNLTVPRGMRAPQMTVVLRPFNQWRELLTSGQDGNAQLARYGLTRSLSSSATSAGRTSLPVSPQISSHRSNIAGDSGCVPTKGSTKTVRCSAPREPSHPPHALSGALTKRADFTRFEARR